VVSDPSPGYISGDGLPRLYFSCACVDGSEDDLIRFEQEIAEISADRDAVEKARLTLMEDYEKLKADSVLSSLTFLTSGSPTKVTRSR
jgi:hypothetical protein